MGGKRGWVHVAASHYHDVVPCVKAARAGDLGQPQQRDARLLAEEADGRGAATSKRPRSCSASPRRSARVRAVSLHPRRDRRHERAAAGQLRDRPRRRLREARLRLRSGDVVRDRLAGAARRARRAAGAARAGAASRRRAACWPRTATGITCSARSPFQACRWAVRRAPRSGCRAHPARLSASCAASTKSSTIERPRPLALGAVQALPVPGRCEIGDAELELHPADGHTLDGMAISIPWARMLVARRLPLTGRDPDAQRRQHDRCLPGDARAPAPAARARRARRPRSRAVMDGARAEIVLDEDVAYLTDLRERGADAELPAGRRSRRAASDSSRERQGARVETMAHHRRDCTHSAAAGRPG